MSKGIKYSIIGIATIILVGFLVLTFSLDYLVKSEIESIGTEMTQTSVTVESVSLSPFSGTGTIEGLKVKNPEGFESEHAIVIQNFDISIDLSSILSDTIMINDIIISDLAVSVIQKVPENNLRILLKNMEEMTVAEGSSSSMMVIEQMLVKNGQVTVTPSIGENPSATVSMGNIEIQNVGMEGSSTSRQVVKQVASRLINEALKSAVSGQLESLKDKAKDAVNDIFN